MKFSLLLSLFAISFSVFATCEEDLKKGHLQFEEGLLYSGAAADIITQISNTRPDAKTVCKLLNKALEQSLYFTKSSQGYKAAELSCLMEGHGSEIEQVSESKKDADLLYEASFQLTGVLREALAKSTCK